MKLEKMTWADVQKEMSIAGSPEKIISIAKRATDLVTQQIDPTNHAELTNMMFALDRIKAEIKSAQKRLEKRTFKTGDSVS